MRKHLLLLFGQARLEKLNLTVRWTVNSRRFRREHHNETSLVTRPPMRKHLLLLFGQARLERSNAALRWRAACRRLDGGNTIVFRASSPAPPDAYASAFFGTARLEKLNLTVRWTVNSRRFRREHHNETSLVTRPPMRKHLLLLFGAERLEIHKIVPENSLRHDFQCFLPYTPTY